MSTNFEEPHYLPCVLDGIEGDDIIRHVEIDCASRYHLDSLSARYLFKRSLMVEVVKSAKPRSKNARRVTNFIARNYLNLFSACLLLTALFYFVQVQQLRVATLSNNPELFSDGDIAVVTRVIDGDEVRIHNSRGSTLVRILGIKSFDATERDLMLAEYGKVAVDYLEEEAVGKEVLVKLGEIKVDDEGRLLATLLLGSQHDQDVAESMLANGVTLVFTKFSFPAMDEYLKIQEVAKSEKLGLWQNQRVSARSESMLNLWNQERRDR
jgi:endonuclease YncB( thermonuclease family)